jgi:hypothetical protein
MNASINKPNIRVQLISRQQMKTFFKKNIIVNLMNIEMGKNTRTKVKITYNKTTNMSTKYYLHFTSELKNKRKNNKW